MRDCKHGQLDWEQCKACDFEELEAELSRAKEENARLSAIVKEGMSGDTRQIAELGKELAQVKSELNQYKTKTVNVVAFHRMEDELAAARAENARYKHESCCDRDTAKQLIEHLKKELSAAQDSRDLFNKSFSECHKQLSEARAALKEIAAGTYSSFDLTYKELAKGMMIIASKTLTEGGAHDND